jgi:hypothetical protein
LTIVIIHERLNIALLIVVVIRFCIAVLLSVAVFFFAADSVCSSIALFISGLRPVLLALWNIVLFIFDSWRHFLHPSQIVHFTQSDKAAIDGLNWGSATVFGVTFPLQNNGPSINLLNIFGKQNVENHEKLVKIARILFVVHIVTLNCCLFLDYIGFHNNFSTSGIY